MPNRNVDYFRLCFLQLTLMFPYNKCLKCRSLLAQPVGDKKKENKEKGMEKETRKKEQKRGQEEERKCVTEGIEGEWRKRERKRRRKAGRV